MPYLFDIKRFRQHCAKVIGRYLRKGDRVLNGLEMALNEMFEIVYVVDILNYILYFVYWEFGSGNCKNCDKQNI